MGRYDDDFGYADDRLGPVEEVAESDEDAVRRKVDAYADATHAPEAVRAELLDALGLS